MARVARALGQPPLATSQSLTSTQTLPPPAGRSRVERLVRVLHRELALQLDFFDGEIAAFRTLWHVAAGGWPPAPTYPIPCADCPLRDTCSLRLQQLSLPAPTPTPAFRNRRGAGQRSWRRPESSHLN